MDASMKVVHVSLGGGGLAPSRVPRITLPARLAAEEEQTREPVRIFVGSEAAQYQAERIFVWSILQHRDPAREYEITLMRDLEGFRSIGWATGFSSYRFAVPHLAGCRGRALYNDVDQIYLRDPAELFDQELDGRGYLVIAPRETSVMLLDCERMARVWAVTAIRRGRRRGLIAAATADPELFGSIHPGWNVRDENEFDPAEARCYHFTTLHKQPWRPFPDRLVYHEHPHQHLWWDLRRSADVAGFQIFDREQPSAQFPPQAAGAEARAGAVSSTPVHRADLRVLLERAEAKSAWVFGAEPTAFAALDALDPGQVAQLGFDELVSGAPGAGLRRDAVVCASLLDTCARDDVPWLLDALFARAGRLLVIEGLYRRKRSRPPWRPPLGMPGTEDWWVDQLESVSLRYPKVRWELVLSGDRRRSRVPQLRRGGGRRLGVDPPSIWVLCGDRVRNNEAAFALADAIGVTAERIAIVEGATARRLRRLVGSGLVNLALGASRRGVLNREALGGATVWPDLVISAGSASLPYARFVREASAHRTGVVQLDDEVASPVAGVDLVATPLSRGALADPRRVGLALPLATVTGVAGKATDTADLAEGRLTVILQVAAADPSELLVWAIRLGESLRKLCEVTGTVCEIAAEEGVPDAIVRKVMAQLPDALRSAPRPTWSIEEAASLAGAIDGSERVVAACVSDDVMVELVAAARTLHIALPQPERASPGRRIRAAIARRAAAGPRGDRGDRRPQNLLESWCSTLWACGVAASSSGAAARRARLLASGAALDLSDPGLGAERRADECKKLAERIRNMIGAHQLPTDREITHP